MRKFVTLVLMSLLLAGGLTACGKKGKPVYKAGTSDHQIEFSVV